MFYRVLIVRTTSLSDRPATLGRQPVSRNVWLIRVKTPLDGVHTRNACHNIPRGKTQDILQAPVQATNRHASTINIAFHSQGH